MGDKVFLEVPGIKQKLAAPRNGPYPILQVHSNGTVHIKCSHVTECVNIRRITPYVESNSTD